MKRWFAFAAAALISSLAAMTWAENYAVDPGHSSAIFRIKHNNAAFLYGRINAPEGSIVYDAAQPEASSFNITMKAANIDTNNANRDNQLKSPSFFNAKEFPNLTFKSTSVKKGEGDSLEVSGDLTIHGVTKPLTVKLDHTENGNGILAGFEGTFTVNRSDFGMKEMLNTVGDDVRIIVSFEARKK
jgi:polyisoprenoid-binding protein YceI